MSALKYHKHGFTKRQIFHLLLKNSGSIAKVGRQRNYSYQVPNQWQGRFEKLKVIGDSTGLTRVRKNPALIKSLERRLEGVKVKLIHCMRNPYDNISAMKFRNGRTLKENIEEYFSMCERVEEIKKQLGSSAVHDLKHEALIASPKQTLEELCSFLDVTATDSYYVDCASILYKSPHKSCLETPWSQELIDIVKHKMSRFSFLEGYSCNGDAPRQLLLEDQASPTWSDSQTQPVSAGGRWFPGSLRPTKWNR